MYGSVREFISESDRYKVKYHSQCSIYATVYTIPLQCTVDLMQYILYCTSIKFQNLIADIISRPYESCPATWFSTHAQVGPPGKAMTFDTHRRPQERARQQMSIGCSASRMPALSPTIAALVAFATPVM